MTFRKIKKIFFVGIGGIGMSGIAELLFNLGYKIEGSDLTRNENVKRLLKLGVKIKIGHDPNNIVDADVLVYSSAVPSEIFVIPDISQRVCLALEYRCLLRSRSQLISNPRVPDYAVSSCPCSVPSSTLRWRVPSRD